MPDYSDCQNSVNLTPFDTVDSSFLSPHLLEGSRDAADRVARRDGGARASTVGLSSIHISPSNGERASLQFFEGAGLAKISLPKPHHPAIPDKKRGGTRGVVSSFSRSSRRRLLRMVASVRRDSLPLFVTLTYPDIFPVAPSQWKRDLDVFAKRFVRRYPDAGFVWKMERQSRKSGENVGVAAPHFHLLVWFKPTSDEHFLWFFREWLSRAWYEVVGSKDDKHLRAGTNAQPVRSFKGAMYYASKYIAKLDEGTDIPKPKFKRGKKVSVKSLVASLVEVVKADTPKTPHNDDDEQPAFFGRWWGVVARDNIPFGALLTFYVSVHDAHSIIRMFRRFAHLHNRSFPSLSCFCDADLWRKALARSGIRLS